MTDEREQEDLDNLVKSPGWQRVVAQARLEWVTSYPVKIKQAIAQARQAHESSDAAVQAVDAANDAINALVSWPQSRLNALKGFSEAIVRQASDPARRGGL